MFRLILMITFILSKCESHMIELKHPSVKVDSKVIVELSVETSPKIRFTPENRSRNAERTEIIVTTSLDKKTEGEGFPDFPQKEEKKLLEVPNKDIRQKKKGEIIEETSTNLNEEPQDFLFEELSQPVVAFTEDKETANPTPILSSTEKVSSRTREEPRVEDTEIEKIGELEKPPHERQKRAPKASKCIPCPQKGKLLHKSSCQKYYECEFNTDCKKLVLKVHSCLKCLTFNAQKKFCDLPENVPECSYPHPTKKFCTRVGTFEVPDDCRKYYHCQKSTNGAISLTIRTCPLSQSFSMKEGKCMEGTECKPRLPECGPGKVYLNDEFSCRRFYYCIGDKSALLFCPPNHLFDGRICDDWGQSELNSENK